MKGDGVESSHRCCALMIGLVWISESGLGHSQRMCCAPWLLPILMAQRDGGPQPWIGWRPRSGREVKRGWGLGPVPLGSILLDRSPPQTGQTESGSPSPPTP
jgi:hypothetical protein